MRRMIGFLEQYIEDVEPEHDGGLVDAIGGCDWTTPDEDFEIDIE